MATSLTVTKRPTEQIERSLSRLQRLAKLMDDQFELPIVKVRVGLDPIIGLIPGGGDWVTWVASVYIIWEALRLGVPIRLLVRMGLMLTLDLVTGYAPGVGDVADVFIKANKRNVELLMRHYDATAPSSENPERVEVPREALEKPKSNVVLRYAFGILLITYLFILAMVPILVLWWLFKEAGA